MVIRRLRSRNLLRSPEAISSSCINPNDLWYFPTGFQPLQNQIASTGTNWGITITQYSHRKKPFITFNLIFILNYAFIKTFSRHTDKKYNKNCFFFLIQNNVNISFILLLINIKLHIDINMTYLYSDIKANRLEQ